MVIVKKNSFALPHQFVSANFVRSTDYLNWEKDMSHAYFLISSKQVLIWKHPIIIFFRLQAKDMI